MSLLEVWIAVFATVPVLGTFGAALSYGLCPARDDSTEVLP